MAGKRLAFREKFGIQKASEMKPTKYLRTGFIRIDNARAEVGRLGFKKGGITVVYGQTGAGKSTLTYQTMAHAQQHDEDTRPWLVADVETSFDALYAASRGVDLERVDVLPIQDWADSTFEAVRQAILSEEYSGIIIDSIHGQAVSRDDKSIEEEKSVGALPMKLTQFIQNTKAAVYKTGIVMILIGQARDNMDKYGDPIHLTGGNALKHDADLILQITRSDARSTCEGVIPKDEKTGKYLGHMTRVKVEKCRGKGMGAKFMMPFVEYEGFSELRCLIEEIVATPKWCDKLLQTTSHHFKWEDTSGELQKLVGKPALMEYFMSKPLELAALQNRLMELVDNESTETLQTVDGG